MSKSATIFRPQHRPGEPSLYSIYYYQYASKTTMIPFLATILSPISGASRRRIATSTKASSCWPAARKRLLRGATDSCVTGRGRQPENLQLWVRLEAWEILGSDKEKRPVVHLLLATWMSASIVIILCVWFFFVPAMCLVLLCSGKMVVVGVAHRRLRNSWYWKYCMLDTVSTVSLFWFWKKY
jgi:hypothetical protein